MELIECFKSAREKEKIHGKILATDMNLYAPALYKADEFFIVPPIKSDKYINAVLDVCLKNNVKAVIPLIDTELQLMAQNKYIFENHGVKVIISDERTVEIAADKYLTYNFLKRIGVDTPLTLLPEEVDDIKLSFPLFIKPRFGSASTDTFKIYDEQELRVFIKRVKAPIVQQFIDGEEYTIDIFCDWDGKPIYITPRRRLAVRGGEISKGIVEKNKELIELTERIIAALNICGPVTLQCIYSGDRYIFTEINARFGGGVPISIIAGADSPRALYKLLKGESVLPDIYGFKEHLTALRYDQTLYLADLKQ